MFTERFTRCLFNLSDDLPRADVISFRYGGTLLLAGLPSTIGIAGENAFPASVSIATTVGQWEAMGLHGRAYVELALMKQRK